jgi:predicted transposase/invertase (TIGR01784 family)
MASKVLMSISRDEVERARLMSELKGELDAQSRLGYAKKEARREGHREGRQEGQLEIARNLKAMGVLSPSQIQTATGLSLEDIEKA